MNQRKIKFRAWDKERKKMYNVLNIDYGGLGNKRTIAHLHLEGLKGEQAFSNFILLQFTGLKDKNGKEIYEGDIVELSSRSIYEEIPNNIC